MCQYGQGIKRKCQKTALLKTILIIFLRNDSKIDNLLPSYILLRVSWLGSCNILASSYFFVHQRKQSLFAITQVQNVFEIGNISQK